MSQYPMPPLLLIVTASAGLLFAACSRQIRDAFPNDSTREQAQDDQTPQPSSRPESQPMADKPSLPVVERGGDNGKGPILLDPPHIPDLERQFHAEKELLPRVELVFRMADVGSPEARQTLNRLYFAVTDVELKIRMIDALKLVDSEDPGPSLVLLRDAVKADRPEELRSAAIDALQTIDDPSTIGIWQGLLSDPNPEFRESALKTIEYYQELHK
jgi:hypothetical protein